MTGSDSDKPGGAATFAGRPLHRPDEEIMDQGLTFDVATLLSRRRVLSMIGIGVVTAGLAACAPVASGGTGSASGNSDGEIPDETAGPYPGDGSNGPNALVDSGIVRSDIRSSIGGTALASGVPIALTLKILDMQKNNAPFESVAVYVWHCDSAGRYSMYSSGVENETYLRGVQVADADGEVHFTSIFPGCYSGRWPHIHFEVYPDLSSISDSTKAISTSQLAMPQDASEKVYALAGYSGSSQNLAGVSLTSDNVFGNDGGVSQLATVTGSIEEGFQVELRVPIDTATTPALGDRPPSGGKPGNPGDQGGGPPPGR
ncbi:MAG: intradiol ring-cleavage dioxygenase [Homoserinimonas sp.]|nr:intradiol ring-cleavage dioxygenase [Homoserinimonas sp.]